jgi:predicted SnoaL-like aldol condensation-catalyzing enzyme
LYVLPTKGKDRQSKQISMRVEHCKIAEHWDVSQPVAEKSVNSNGMF